VTNDLAIGLKTSLQVAEELKIQHGSCDLSTVADDDLISVSMLGEAAGRTISRVDICRIIEARMRETFELLGAEIKAAGEGVLPAGLVLTGGASQLAGAAALGREVLNMPVRVAGPSDVGGLTDNIMNPAYSTAIGLLYWGAKGLDADDRTPYPTAPVGGLPGRVRDALRKLFP
jgi:cell division protein FtsA